MAYILDTHTFLWFVEGSDKLPLPVKKIIKDINKSCFISIASFWEIAIKLKLGKLHSDLSLVELLALQKEIKLKLFL